MRVLLRASGALAVLVAAVFVSSVSDATEDDAQARARGLFQEGNTLVEAARYADALEKFRAAYAAWENPKIKLNLATTLRALGRYAESLEAYREYLAAADPTPDKREEVLAVCRELEARVARVSIRSARSLKSLSIDGRALSLRAEAVAVDAGHHVLVAETDDGVGKVLAFDVAAADERSLTLNFEALTPAAPAVPRDATASNSAVADPSLGDGPLFLARVDVDGRGRGAVGAAGIGYHAGDAVRVEAGGLFGVHSGAFAGVELSPFGNTLRPTLGISVPVFFVEGPRLGVSGELGLRQALSRTFAVSARAALVHFPSVPAGFASTVFVPSLGVEARP